MKVLQKIVLTLIVLLLMPIDNVFALEGGYLGSHPEKQGVDSALFDGYTGNYFVPDSIGKEKVIAHSLGDIRISGYYVSVKNIRKNNRDETIKFHFYNQAGELRYTSRLTSDGDRWVTFANTYYVDYITYENVGSSNDLYLNEFEIKVRDYDPQDPIIGPKPEPEPNPEPEPEPEEPEQPENPNPDPEPEEPEEPNPNPNPNPEPEPEPEEPEQPLPPTDNGICEACKKFWNSIFGPPIAFLDMAIEQLRKVQLVTAQGLNIGKYFAIFGDLPFAWQLVVSSILLSTVLLGTLLIFRSIMRLYYAVKEGVKWW